MGLRVHDRRTVVALVFVSLVSLAPFARGLLGGQLVSTSGIWRPSSSRSAPSRPVALAHGQLRYWNPLDHEGVPLPYPPLSYPFDALQALLPGPFADHAAPRPPRAARRRSRSSPWRVRWGRRGSPPRAPGSCTRSAASASRRSASTSTSRPWPGCRSSCWRCSGSHGAGAGLLGRPGDRHPRLDAGARVPDPGARDRLRARALAAGRLGAGSPADSPSRVRAGVRPLGRLASAAALGIALAAPTLLVMRAVLRESARGAGLAPGVTLAHSAAPLHAAAGARRQPLRRHGTTCRQSGGASTSSRAASPTS